MTHFQMNDSYSLIFGEESSPYLTLTLSNHLPSAHIVTTVDVPGCVSNGALGQDHVSASAHRARSHVEEGDMVGAVAGADLGAVGRADG